VSAATRRPSAVRSAGERRRRGGTPACRGRTARPAPGHGRRPAPRACVGTAPRGPGAVRRGRTAEPRPWKGKAPDEEYRALPGQAARVASSMIRAASPAARPAANASRNLAPPLPELLAPEESIAHELRGPRLSEARVCRQPAGVRVAAEYGAVGEIDSPQRQGPTHGRHPSCGTDDLCIRVEGGARLPRVGCRVGSNKAPLRRALLAIRVVPERLVPPGCTGRHRVEHRPQMPRLRLLRHLVRREPGLGDPDRGHGPAVRSEESVKVLDHGDPAGRGVTGTVLVMRDDIDQRALGPAPGPFEHACHPPPVRRGLEELEDPALAPGRGVGAPDHHRRRSPPDLREAGGQQRQVLVQASHPELLGVRLVPDAHGLHRRSVPLEDEVQEPDEQVRIPRGQRPNLIPVQSGPPGWRRGPLGRVSHRHQ
jgi:hypothetical protein